MCYPRAFGRRRALLPCYRLMAVIQPLALLTGNEASYEPLRLLSIVTC